MLSLLPKPALALGASPFTTLASVSHLEMRGMDEMISKVLSIIKCHDPTKSLIPFPVLLPAHTTDLRTTQNKMQGPLCAHFPSILQLQPLTHVQSVPSPVPSLLNALPCTPTLLFLSAISQPSPSSSLVNPLA